MKHPKLSGADVYVVRLAGNDNASTSVKARETVDTSQSTTSSALPRPVSPAISLYDELLNKEPTQISHLKATKADEPSAHTAAESRPCYRCVFYMHSVGIKRVFWSNSQGVWESAKVRDLVDRFDGSYVCCSSCSNRDEASVADLGVFVTKHEVLRLRRLTSN
jgi:hypothetical protein